jgi:hypothetical protein
LEKESEVADRKDLTDHAAEIRLDPFDAFGRKADLMVDVADHGNKRSACV